MSLASTERTQISIDGLRLPTHASATAALYVHRLARVYLGILVLGRQHHLTAAYDVNLRDCRGGTLEYGGTWKGRLLYQDGSNPLVVDRDGPTKTGPAGPS